MDIPSTDRSSPVVRALIAEDDEANRSMLALLLSSMGCTVEAVPTGREAVDQFRSGQFDLVILDLQMPRMGGIQAAKEIRAHERALGTGPVRLAAYSGSDAPEDLEAGRSAGFDRYLFKPARVEEIRALLTFPPRPPRPVRPFPEGLLPLAQLAEGDLSVMRQAVDLFLLRLPDLLGAMDAAEVQGDLDAMARTAHRLKGSVSLLGDRDVLMLTLDLLERARGGDSPGSTALLLPLRGALDHLASRLSDQAFWDDLAERIPPK